jgi:hypothetical protein
MSTVPVGLGPDRIRLPEPSDRGQGSTLRAPVIDSPVGRRVREAP